MPLTPELRGNSLNKSPLCSGKELQVSCKPPKERGGGTQSLCSGEDVRKGQAVLRAAACPAVPAGPAEMGVQPLPRAGTAPRAVPAQGRRDERPRANSTLSAPVNQQRGSSGNQPRTTRPVTPANSHLCSSPLQLPLGSRKSSKRYRLAQTQPLFAAEATEAEEAG